MPIIALHHLLPTHIAALADIQLTPQQALYAGTASDFLADQSPTRHRHVILADDIPIGFFKLDTAYASHFDFCPPGALGLRAFALDRRQQGKGLGTAAVRALFPYLRDHYPHCTALYLTVNCQNPAAHACYLKGGFQDTGSHYLGGPAGPQHILYHPIADGTLSAPSNRP